MDVSRGSGLFKPKVYKSNGLEAYHLISDEGGSFLYEGKIDYNDAELFNDEQGKAYYLVTTDIGGPSKYYVEVEPVGKPIPAVQKEKEKSISDLVKTTPEEQAHEAAKPVSEPAKVPETPKEPEAVPAPLPEPMPMDTGVKSAPKETCFETPEKPAEEKPTTTEEAQAAVRAMASLGENRPHKKSRLPVILALLLIALIVAGAAIAVYRPDLISRLPFIGNATPTPGPTLEPTVTPTPEPTATSTITPTPTLQGGGDIYRNLLAIAPAINASDPAVTGYVANNSNQSGTSYGHLAKVCDLYDAVNKRWSLVNGNGTPRSLNTSVETMEGSMMDYSVLMASLAEAEGMDARIVAVYNEDMSSYVYYPEIKVAPNDSDYNDALIYLRARYDIVNPYGHADGIVHWLSLSLNKTPGGYVDTKFAYTVNSKSEITGV